MGTRVEDGLGVSDLGRVGVCHRAGEGHAKEFQRGEASLAQGLAETDRNG